IAAKIPNEGLFFFAWIIGGICVLAGALTYAELSGAYPYTGGVFVYLREGFGRLPAFLFGWAELTIVRASALGAIATVFAEYLLKMFGVASAVTVHYVAAASILLVAAFNFAGVNVGAAVQNLTANAKYVALLVLVAASFLLDSHPQAMAGAPVSAGDPGVSGITAFGLALISILWVYDGWADVTFISGEVK